MFLLGLVSHSLTVSDDSLRRCLSLLENGVLLHGQQFKDQSLKPACDTSNPKSGWQQARERLHSLIPLIRFFHYFLFLFFYKLKVLNQYISFFNAKSISNFFKDSKFEFKIALKIIHSNCFSIITYFVFVNMKFLKDFKNFLYFCILQISPR